MPEIKCHLDMTRGRSGRFTTSIERGDKDIELEVHFILSPGMRGHRDKFDAPEEPDDEPSMEITKAINQRTGEDMDLSEKEKRALERRSWDYLEDDRDLTDEQERRLSNQEWEKYSEIA
jgi:hypothetical protein